ncbi:MAG: hypothetical protein ACRDMH_15830 [Solirubrobacterales bacterium]
MSDDRFARYGAASGILAVLLTAGAFVGFILPNAPDLDAPGTDWATYFTAHQSRIQVGVIVLGVGLFFFIWFLGSLRSALARAEGGEGRLASVAFGGGIVAVASLLIAASAGAVAALRPEDLDPNTTRALNDLGVVAGGPGAAGFTALFAATAIVGYRHRAVPAPVAGLSALAAITQPLAYGVAVTDSGAFAASGLLGGFIPIITFVVAALALSYALIREPQGHAAAASD